MGIKYLIHSFSGAEKTGKTILHIMSLIKYTSVIFPYAFVETSILYYNSVVALNFTNFYILSYDPEVFTQVVGTWMFYSVGDAA